MASKTELETRPFGDVASERPAPSCKSPWAECQKDSNPELNNHRPTSVDDE